MSHGLPQIFAAGLGAGLAAAVAEGNGVRGTIVLNYDRMIDGEIGSALLKICHRKSARLQQLLDQVICLGHSASGFIIKLRLHRPPASGEIYPAGFGEWAEGKRFAVLGGHLQNAFGALRFDFLPNLFNRAVIIQGQTEGRNVRGEFERGAYVIARNCRRQPPQVPRLPRSRWQAGADPCGLRNTL